MKLSATFEEGTLSLILTPETEAEQLMVGSVICQPQAAEGFSYMDKNLISAVGQYEGHWTNKRVRSLRLSVFKPNEAKP